MKKLLTLKRLLFLLTLFIGINAWSADYTLHFTKLTTGTNYNSYTASHTTTSDNIEWAIYGNQSVGDNIRVGGKNTTATNRTITQQQPALSIPVSKITINHSGIGNGKDSEITINSISVKCAGNSSFNDATIVTVNTPDVSSAGALEFTPESGFWPANSFYQIIVNYQITGTNNSYLTIDNIVFQEANGSSQPTKYNVTIANDITGGTVTASHTTAAANTEVTLTATPNEGFEFSSWNITPSTVTVSENNKFTMPAADVTVSATFSELDKYNITWSINGTETTESYYYGATAHAPSVSAVNGKDFVGWVTTPTVDATTTPLFVKDFTVKKEAKYYAVYAIKTSDDIVWKKTQASEVNEAGIYALLTIDGHAFNGTISSGHGQVTTDMFSFDEDGQATEVPEGTCELTFEKVDNGGYTMFNAGKGYLYATAASSGKLSWSTNSTKSWKYNEENWEYMELYTDKYARLRSYSNNSIRTYGTNNGDVLVLAKKLSGGTSFSDFTTTPGTAKTPTQLSFEDTYDKQTITKYIGEPDFTATATLTPQVEGATISYESSDDDIALVIDGVVTLGNTEGSATIAAKYAGNDQYEASESSYTIDLKKLPAPTFSPAAGEVVAGTKVTITSIPGSTITYEIGDDIQETESNIASIIINEATTITALASYNGVNSDEATASYTIKPDAVLYVVTLSTGRKISQTSEGGSISLPSFENVDDWTFIGWSTTNNGSVETTTPPVVISAGEYIPTVNVTLYPVFSRSEIEGEGETAVIKYSGNTTNMTDENNAESVGLDDTKWSVTANKGGSANYPGLNKDGSIRLYYHANGNNSITVTNLEGKTINNISLTFNPGYDNISVEANGKTITKNSDNSYTINNSSFTIGNANTENKQVQIKSITISIGETTETVYYITTPYTVSLPVISSSNGTLFDEASTVITISTEDENCTIYYTTDNTEPTVDSSLYNAPFELNETTTIKAIAVDTNGKLSKSRRLSVNKVDLVHVKNIAEFNAITEADGLNVIFDNPVVVLYDYSQYSGSYQEYIWVKDETGYAEIYLTPSFDTKNQVAKYENGDVIPAGFKATKKYYSNGKYIEAETSPYNNFGQSTTKALAEPELLEFDTFRTLTVNDTTAWSNRYILMKNVSFTKYANDKYGRTYSISYNGTTTDASKYMLYNKYDDQNAKKKDGTSATVDVDNLDASKTYNVYGICQIYSGKWEIMPLVFEEYKPESLTLKELVTKGNAGQTDDNTDYTISNDLQVVACVGGNILLMKDANGQATNMVAKPEGYNEKLINAVSTFMDGAEETTNQKQQSNYDQSNWIEVVLPEGTENPEGWVNLIVAGNSITGKYTDTVNPRLVLNDDAEMTEKGETEGAYYRNPMTVSNFIGNQNGYFFMTPKPNEYVQVVWAIYNNGYFYPEAKNSPIQFGGKIGINYEYNCNRTPALENNCAYQFKAIVKAKGTGMSASAPAKLSAYPNGNEANFVLYPINLDHVIGIITGIDDITVNSAVKAYKTIENGQVIIVRGDQRFNIMGQPVR